MATALPVEQYQGHGLLSKLYEDCKRYNSLSDEVALACACQVISAVTQRRYALHVGSTALYQMIIAPLGGGKEGYRRWIEAYLRAVDSKLTGTSYRSDQALKVGLSEHPSQVLIIDEIADNLSGAYDKRAPDAMQQDLITIWNELYNAVPLMSGSRTKKDTIKSIERPRLGICGFSTPGMFAKLMTMREYTETGLYSRFQTYVIEGEHYEAWDDERAVYVTPVPELLEELRRLACGDDNGVEPDDTVVYKVDIDSGALRLLQNYAQGCKHDALQAIEPAYRGMHRRIRELTARKMAGIRALAIGRLVIMPADVRWGIQQGERAWARTQAALGEFGGSEEAQAQAVMLEKIKTLCLKGGDVPTYISVLKNSKRYRSMDAHVFMRLVQGLVLTGQVELSGPTKKYVYAHAGEPVPGPAFFEGDLEPGPFSVTH